MPTKPEIAFLFPGGGAQHVDMGRELYEKEETFRREMDRCCDLFAPSLGVDLRALVHPAPEEADAARRELARPAVFLPALFAVEWALAQLWMSRGVRPVAMLGHSFGEYVAATLAGVFRLEDAIVLLVHRGRLFETLSGGAMLSVTLPAAEVEPLLDGRLSLAVDNGPDLCVVAGFAGAVDGLAGLLAARGVKHRRVPVEGASHCLLVEPILEPFERFVAGLPLAPPAIPYVSNVTGTWVTADQATDPAHWARHLRETVRFRQGLAELDAREGCVLLEVGPGTTLSSLAKRQPGVDARRVVASMRHPSDPQGDAACLLAATRRLDGSDPETGSAGEAPFDEGLADELAGLFRELLGAAQVGPGDSFFDLGGHSLLATQLLSRLRQVWGVEMPVERLFAAPTPALLARELAGARSGPEAPLFERVPRDGPLPLSFAQRRLWFLDRLEPGSPLYNIAASFRLRGPLDVGALERSLTEIVRRHEVLRTVFAEVDGEPVQIIGPPFALELPKVDLRGREEEAQRRAREALAEPFDLGRGPLIRGELVQLGEDDWRLDLALHHVAFDRWSRMVFERELEALYAAPSSLPDLPLQYADFAVWQRRWMQGEVLAEQLAFWSSTLQGLPALELPSDRPRSPVQAVQSHQGGRRTLAPTEPPRCSGATLFMSLLAAFAALLARHADSADLAVGSPIAGRNRAEVEGLIGFFINTLALRVRLGGDPTFGELVDRVREACLAAYAHQDLPFERLVEELAPARDLSRAPFFQVMLVLQNVPVRPLRLPGLEVTPIEVTTDTAKADLTLFVRTAEEGLAAEIAAEIEYSADLFDAATVDRLGERWAVLLRAASADPGLRLSELPILAAEEEYQILREWPGRRVAYARDATLPELFARQVSRSPDAVALVQGSETLTYAELHRRAGRVARRLRALGVGPEVPVGLLAERSPALIAGMLGILQAGGAYVPLDPTHPPERWAELLEDVGAPVLVTAGMLAAGLSRKPAEILHLEEALDGPDGDPAVPLDADNLAYVMYTSGSTGAPKGVAVTHRNVIRLIDGADYLELGPAETFLQLAPIAFDASTLEIWGPLLTGGRLVLFPGDRPDLAELGRTVREGGVTALWLTAGLFHAWIDADPESFQGVRQLLAGGDVVEPGAVRRLLESHPEIAFVNGYGPTEGTTFTCCHRIADPSAVGSPVPIGRPVPNSSAWILDRDLRPVPIGVPGELLAGGDGLARGYAGRPDLTAERFVPSPFGDGERLYRTGDLARRRPDGTIEFLGRADDQIKISGVRVEPAEVEAALARHPMVRRAAVVPVQGAAGRALAACVTLEQPVPANELRAWLRERLPEAFVPTRLAIVDELPLTPNGKVDRTAIATLAVEEPEDAPEEPLSPLEEALAGLWAAALDRPRVGRHDSFFDLGGHSLLAVRLIAEIRRAFRLDLPLRTFFEHPTVAELARLLADRDLDSVPLPPVEPAPGRKPDEAWTAPLSSSQGRLWFLDRLVPGGAFLNVARAVELRGALDPAALRRALEEVVGRHEALRTTFAMEGGRPVQRIAPRVSVPLPEIDLEALPAARRRREAERLAWTEARRPFDPAVDPATGPLLRAARVRLESGRSVLLLVVHHLVLDGWSLGIVFRELAALYRSPASLPVPAAQYPDFAVWQQDLVRTPAMERQRAFWRARLEGLTELRLRGDRPRPAHPTFAGARLDERLPPGLVAAVDRLRVTRGATRFMAVLAAFEALMARYCGAHDFAVGSPVASRGRPELHGVVGFCVNMLPLRAGLSGRPGWRQLLERVRDDALAAYAHQDLPFETLVEELRTERDLGSSPLFQVAMTVEDEPPLPSFPGLAAEAWEVDPGPALFDLTLFAARAGEGLRLTFNYKTALFDRTTVQRLAGHFETLVAGMTADPERPVDELPLLTEAERQALREWNAPPPLEPDAEQGLIALFERQAAVTPDAVAVTGPSGRLEGDTLTYGGLNARANRIAHRLRELGVGRGTPVGLCLPPSPDLLAGMLGIVKAGGAYVPLDPTYPAERWAVILDEARVPLLVTTSPLAALLPASCGARLLLLDALEDGPHDDPVPLAGDDDLLYLIFTSGSTGRPKGVGIVRRSFADLVRWYTEELAVDGTDVFLILTSAGFDLTQKNLWGPLTRGARVLFTPGYEPAVLTALVEREGATAVNCTPSAFYPLIEREEWGRLSSFRKVVVGGETTALERLARWREAAGPVRLLNTYGPTECTDMCGFVDLDGWRAGPAPLGRPIPGAALWLVDPALQPAPAGVAGQIAIGGPCVGPGYLRAPALTADRFVPDAFSGESGGRLYLTGDLARRLPDGVLEFLGRIDHQVKIRGHRVEPGEVEAALAAHPAVRRAAVLPYQAPGGTFLGAWVAPQPGWQAGSALVAELRGFLRRRLPEPMVPSAFQALDELPLTPHGKVDRDALAARSPLQTAAVSSRGPGNDAERAVARAWKKVLGVAEVGGDDNFFDLGGHSLAMIAVQEELRRDLGTELSLVEMFENPTPRALAEQIEGRRASPRAGAPPPPQPGAPWREHARRARDWAQGRQGKEGVAS